MKTTVPSTPNDTSKPDAVTEPLDNPDAEPLDGLSNAQIALSKALHSPTLHPVWATLIYWGATQTPLLAGGLAPHLWREDEQRTGPAADDPGWAEAG